MALRLPIRRQAAALAKSWALTGSQCTRRTFSATPAVSSLADGVKQAIAVSSG